ncbi:MAG: penicillin-binding protein 1C, partial [Alphaproteobacteria bacterium]|nr:penicillin-binding protein 1C [Alphaproteobacteria bacterium]
MGQAPLPQPSPARAEEGEGGSATPPPLRGSDGAGVAPKRARRRLAIAIAAAAAIVIAAVAADRAFPPPLERAAPRSVVVAGADGAMLRPFANAEGRWRLPTTVEDVDPRYLRLLIAIEDSRFHQHVGVDPLAVARAAVQLAANGRIVSGASTLTMQTARLLEPRPRGILTKLAQAARALQLETRLTKSAILDLYLTLAPFGGNLEGVRAASLAWFGKEPGHLTTGESALLVALPQSPERLRPDRHPEAARRARDRVIDRAEALGLIPADEAAAGRAEPVPTARQPLPMLSPHLAQRLARGAGEGAVVATTLDARLQRNFERLARDEAFWFGDGAAVAIVAVETRGRAVRAWVGGTNFFGPAGQVDLARARRSPGSALKPFIYALAFDDGIAHPETLIDDMPMRFGDWAPRNFDREFQGRLTVRTALQQSLNIPAVALLDRVGPVRFVAALRDTGARLAFRPLTGGASLPVALGGVGIDLADLTMLYAALADGGLARPLVTTPGAPGLPAAEPVRIAEARSAWYVVDILSGTPLPDGWAASRIVDRPRQLAYKTGTSYGFRDAWAVGMSARWTVGVWVGRADGTARPGHFARNTAAPILLKAFDLLPPDDGERATPPEAAIASSTGALPEGLRYFRPAERGGASAPAPILSAVRPPRILYPPDGAVIELEADEMDSGVTLRADGEGPLTWVVNGQPLPASPFAGQTLWLPDGEGFARIVVVDHRGYSARA